MGTSVQALERKASGGVNTVATLPNEKCNGLGRFGGVLSVNALAGAVPAGAYRRDGFVFSSDGRLCTTTTVAGTTLKDGIRRREDGVVLTAATGAISATSRMVHTPIGSLRVSVDGAIHTA